MRRIHFRIFVAVILFVTAAPAWAAQTHEPVEFEPFDIDAGVWCAFPIHVGVVANDEFQDVTTLPDDTTVIQIRGRLVLSFTNSDTGLSIVRNVSGPTTTIVQSDGSGTFLGEGNNWFGFGPRSQGNILQPGLVFTSGQVVLQFADGAVTSYSLKGKQVNGCELLAGQ